MITILIKLRPKIGHILTFDLADLVSLDETAEQVLSFFTTLLVQSSLIKSHLQFLTQDRF